MNRTTQTTRVGIALLALMSSVADAALLSRAGGLAYYDTVLDLTWVADANLAASNTFGVSGIAVDGGMTWDKANDWIAAMNSASYLGASAWRLPVIVDTGSAGCFYAYSGTDCGYNVQTVSGSTVYSEMAHLFQVTLGNLPYYDTTGAGPQPGWGLANAGPFANLQAAIYWSGTAYAPEADRLAWHFDFNEGRQYRGPWTTRHFAWAVHAGDMLVPVPAAAWLFASALGIGQWLRRRALATAG